MRDLLLTALRYNCIFKVALKVQKEETLHLTNTWQSFGKVFLNMEI